jgi:hypothetical protein
VAAYLRRCQIKGVFGAVRRRGAEEAGAVLVKLALLDRNAMLPRSRNSSATASYPSSARCPTGWCAS